MKDLSRALLSGLLAASFAASTAAPQETAAPQTKPFNLQDLSRALEALTRRVSPAVVQIYVSGYGLVQSEGSSDVSYIAKQRGTGSGVILDSSGYIITNSHVVEGAQRVRVLLSHLLPAVKRADDEAASKAPSGLLEARIVGADKETDLALIRIDRTGLPTLRFANSNLVRAGQLALALGSPLGLQNSLSMGVVSSAQRQLKPDDTMVYIQTDAPINPGNSGGPLLNADGDLIGINTFILSQSGGSEGVGFAIPSNIVRSVYTQLRQHGHVHRGEIGVSVQTITPVISAGLGLSRNWGVVVADVEPDGPADQAGLKAGDVILTLEGRPMESARVFEVGLYRRGSGEQASLEVQRGSDKLTIKVPVHERADTGDRLADIANPKDHLIRRLGILCLEIDKKLTEMLGPFRIPYGLVVAARSADSAQQGIELTPGDIIHSINTMPLSTVAALRGELNKLGPGDSAVFQVERGGKLRYVAVTIE